MDYGYPKKCFFWYLLKDGADRESDEEGEGLRLFSQTFILRRPHFMIKYTGINLTEKEVIQ